MGLRPSIVFGPRSRWCSDLAREAIERTAYLIQEGHGICNTIYIDNLIDAIVLAAEAKGVDGQYFLVRDKETVTWREFYEPILKACGVSVDEIHHVEAPPLNGSKKVLLISCEVCLSYKQSNLFFLRRRYASVKRH